MTLTSNRARAHSGHALSYGERSDLHWRSLAAAHKRQILLYLARRLARRARRCLGELGKVLVIETVDFARLARAYGCLLAVSVIKLARELTDENARREFAAILDSLRTGRFLRIVWAELVVIVALFAVITALPRHPSGPSIVEQARLVRNHPPPPCVSDGDGGIWIDVGERYVKQRDAGYARLRQELCGD